MLDIWMALGSIIPTEQVPPRTFFLKEMLAPWIIWTLRIGIVLTAIVLIIAYFEMKRKSKNGE